MINNWLNFQQRFPCVFNKFVIIDAIENQVPTKEIQGFLKRNIIDSLANLDYVKDAAVKLGWSRVNEWLKVRRPKGYRLKRGDFGEILINTILKYQNGYKIPVEKLRLRIKSDESLPGIDSIAIYIENNEIKNVFYIESKLRTSTDNKVGFEAHEQLKTDYLNNQEAILMYTGLRLFDSKSDIYSIFMEYLTKSKSSPEKDGFCISLTWDKDHWNEIVLEKIDEIDVNDVLDPLTVYVIGIKDLINLIDKIYIEIGVEVISDV